MIIGYGFTTSQIRHECESQLVNGGVAAVDTSCLLRLESEGFVVKNDKEACLLNEAKRSELNTSPEVDTDLRRPLELAVLWGSVVVYVVLTPRIFFGTLGAAHGPMQRE